MHSFDVCISIVRSNRYVIQIILLPGFDVCISIVRSNRYVIQIISLPGFDVCISIVRSNRYVIQIISLPGFDVCISIVRLNRYVIQISSLPGFDVCISIVSVAQSIACPPLKRSVVGSILLSGPSCSLGYIPFQPVVHNWFIKGRSMYYSVYGKVHIKDPLLLIEKSSLCGGSGFPSKKCVNVTI